MSKYAAFTEQFTFTLKIAKFVENINLFLDIWKRDFQTYFFNDSIEKLT